MQKLILLTALALMLSTPSFAKSNLASHTGTASLAEGRLHKAVEFEHCKVRVRSAGRARLTAIASWWKANPTPVVIRIEGHGYAIHEEASIELGQRRADRVRDYLVAQGVDPKYVVAIGHSRSEIGRYVDLVFEPAKQ